MAKVFIGVGHGGSDPGAVKYLREEEVNLNMAFGCKEYLESKGIEVRMSRYKDENDPTTEEVKECNAYNPDLAVDIHNNSGGGDGFECYYHHLGGNSKRMAQNIERAVKAFGQNSRGCKIRLNKYGKDYYGFIRDTKSSAVIVEGLFVDNKKDIQIADTLEEQKAFGIAIAKGIIETLIQIGKYIEKDDIQYRVHIQDIGWQEPKENGEIAGTEGKEKRIEAIEIYSDLPIEYRAHVEGKGWLPWVKNGEMAGTEGEGRRLEAVDIKSSKPIIAKAHIQNLDWQDEITGTEIRIGTVGESLRLEALTLRYE